MTVAIRINDNYHVEELQGKYILDPVTDEVGDIDMESSGVPYGIRQGMTWLFRDNFVLVDFWDALNADPSRVIDNRQEGNEEPMNTDPHVDTTQAEAGSKGTHKILITVNTLGELHAVLTALIDHGIVADPEYDVKVIQI